MFTVDLESGSFWPLIVLGLFLVSLLANKILGKSAEGFGTLIIGFILASVMSLFIGIMFVYVPLMFIFGASDNLFYIVIIGSFAYASYNVYGIEFKDKKTSNNSDNKEN